MQTQQNSSTEPSAVAETYFSNHGPLRFLHFIPADLQLIQSHAFILENYLNCRKTAIAGNYAVAYKSVGEI